MKTPAEIAASRYVEMAEAEHDAIRRAYLAGRKRLAGRRVNAAAVEASAKRLAAAKEKAGA